MSFRNNLRTIAIAILALSTPISSGKGTALKAEKSLIAHRGASAYAPEHTLEAYRLAITQGADYVEQDLQISKDGVLVCLHDLTLERTTNVEEVFPARFRTEQPGQASGSRRWYVSDFTLAELKQLDAGTWFSEKFRGARIPTFQEAIDAVRGKAGIYPETKAPEVYGNRGFDMEKLVLERLKANRLDLPGADPKTPVIVQSFSAASLRKLAIDLKSRLTLVFLVNDDPNGALLSEEGLRKAKEFCHGIGPAKRLIENNPDIVKRAHALGLTVTPYTFRSGSTGRFKDVREEMRQFLYVYGVDAVFTDNPDQFPRQE
jgi:glycerophosphoryl diester phosphodiesterase